MSSTAAWTIVVIARWTAGYKFAGFSWAAGLGGMDIQCIDNRHQENRQEMPDPFMIDFGVKRSSSEESTLIAPNRCCVSCNNALRLLSLC